MGVALTVSDKQDGSGGVATISGSSGGPVNLFAAPWTGQMQQPQAWTPAGTRTGDGTIAVASPGALALGYYLWLVLDAGNYATVFQNLTDASAHTVVPRALDAIQLRIQGLNLPGLDNLQVLEKWVPRAVPGVDTMPCIQICPYDAENFPEVLNSTDDIGLPIIIAIWAPGNGNDGINKVILDWRWMILSAFRYQGLAGVPEIYNCEPVAPRRALAATPPDAFVDLEKFVVQGVVLSALLLNFISRTARG